MSKKTLIEENLDFLLKNRRRLHNTLENYKIWIGWDKNRKESIKILNALILEIEKEIKVCEYLISEHQKIIGIFPK